MSTKFIPLSKKLNPSIYSILTSFDQMASENGYGDITRQIARDTLSLILDELGAEFLRDKIVSIERGDEVIELIFNALKGSVIIKIGDILIYRPKAYEEKFLYSHLDEDSSVWVSDLVNLQALCEAIKKKLGGT